MPLHLYRSVSRRGREDRKLGVRRAYELAGPLCAGEASIKLSRVVASSPQPFYHNQFVGRRVVQICSALHTPLSNGELPTGCTLKLKNDGLEGAGPNDVMLATTCRETAPVGMIEVDGQQFPVTNSEVEAALVQHRSPYIHTIWNELPKPWGPLSKTNYHRMLSFAGHTEPMLDMLGNEAMTIGQVFLNLPSTVPTVHEFIQSVQGVLSNGGIQPLFLAVGLWEPTYTNNVESQRRSGHAVIHRAVRNNWYAVFVVHGILILELIGYAKVRVPPGSLLIYPARMWVKMLNDSENLALYFTLAF